MQRVILHIDFDSFFASAEQLYNPQFRGRPLGVTATNGRTCIIAASREAKKRGVKSPLNKFAARQICPEIIFTKANFILYWEISKKFIAICKDYSPFIEVFSIDELFMDITETAHLFGGTYALIRKIKQRIRKEIGEFITVSNGISHNKLLSKLASGLKKPDGVMEIVPHDVEDVYKTTDLMDICGIGERIKRRLNSLGIYTLLQLRDAPLTSLIAEFGRVEGAFLKNIGYGSDNRPVVPYTDPQSVKSVSRNYCLPENEYCERTVLQNIFELCEEIGIKLRRLHKKAKRIGLYLGGSQSIHGYLTSGEYVDTGKELYELCLCIISNNVFSGKQSLSFETAKDKISSALAVLHHDENFYVRRIGIYAGHLEDRAHLPLPLFADHKKQEKIAEVMDRLNDKFGDHTIRNGFLLYADKLTTVPNGYGPDTVEKEKLVRLGL